MRDTNPPVTVAATHTPPALAWFLNRLALARTNPGRTVVVREAWRDLPPDLAQRVAEADHAARAQLAAAPPIPCQSPSPARAPTPRSPDRAASIERRRQLAAEGWMPPELARHFPTGPLAVLAVVAREVRTRGTCALYVDAIAALAGVCRSTVKATLRLAATLGFITRHERRIARDRSDTTIVRIVAGRWLKWLRRRGVGSKSRLRPVPKDSQGDRTSHQAPSAAHESASGASSALGRTQSIGPTHPGPLQSRWTRRIASEGVP